MAEGTLGLTPSLIDYLDTVRRPEPDVLMRLRHRIAEQHEAHWHIAPDQAQFMGLLATIAGTKRYLEVGTFAGYGTLAMALACPALEIVTCEIADEFVALGRPFWEEAGVAGRIDLCMGPAADTMTALVANGARFDMVFIDADKGGYPTYLSLAKQLVPAGGLILVDNVYWSGAVGDPSDTRRSTRAIREVNAMLRDDEDLAVAVTNIGDGLAIARKL